MRRIWFKKRMRRAILDGVKTSTTRDHLLYIGEYLAVCGSRYTGKPFAIIQITNKEETTWREVLELHYKEEGFKSPEDMKRWCVKENILKHGTLRQVWRYDFKMIEKL